MREGYLHIEKRDGTIIFGVTMQINDVIHSYDTVKRYLDPVEIKAAAVVVLQLGEDEDWIAREYELKGADGFDIERRYRKDGSVSYERIQN